MIVMVVVMITMVRRYRLVEVRNRVQGGFGFFCNNVFRLFIYLGARTNIISITIIICVYACQGLRRVRRFYFIIIVIII